MVKYNVMKIVFGLCLIGIMYNIVCVAVHREMARFATRAHITNGQTNHGFCFVPVEVCCYCWPPWLREISIIFLFIVRCGESLRRL